MSTSKSIKSILKCSFCAKPKSKVKLLVMGPNDETTGIPYCICNECIALKKKEMDESLTIAEVVND